MIKTILKTVTEALARLPLKRIERIEKVAAPALIAAAVITGTAVSAVQIRRDKRRRKRWALPLTILGAVVLIGVTAAIVEAAVSAQPSCRFSGGAYVLTGNGTACSQKSGADVKL